MILLRINQNDKIPIFRQLTEQIKMKIASGELKGGQQLPSVRELAVSLSLNPNTVMKSYRELEKEGFVVTKKGKGVYVKDTFGEVDIKNLKKEFVYQKIKELIIAAKTFNISKEELLGEIEKAFKEAI